MRKIGKKFIRNFVTDQLSMCDKYLDADRVDVMARGKLLGFASKDHVFGEISYMWYDEGDIARDCRTASQKLRKCVREWARDVTDAIYARGLEHLGRYNDRCQLEAALDQELADYVEADAVGMKLACEFDWDVLMDAVDIRNQSLISIYGKYQLINRFKALHYSRQQVKKQYRDLKSKTKVED